MIAGKVRHMWRPAADGAALHYAILVLGLAGLAVLLLRGRWEVAPTVLLLAGISAIGGLLLAGTRRNLPVMPLVIALAGVAVVVALEWSRARLARRGEPEPVDSVLAPH